MNKTAEQIHLGRVKKNMTPKELAKKCGVTASYIEQVESGKKVPNESIAKRILKVLGVDENSISQEATAQKQVVEVKKKPAPKKVSHASIDYAPSWSKALDNVLRHYPIYNAYTKKQIGEKVIPTLDRKVEGYHCDKITLIEVFDTSMTRFDLQEHDVLMVYLTQDITNNKLYYVEYENQPYRLYKDLGIPFQKL
jgi:transcriptional regulator with XRE-family HTH domain